MREVSSVIGKIIRAQRERARAKELALLLLLLHPTTAAEQSAPAWVLLTSPLIPGVDDVTCLTAAPDLTSQ